MRGIERKGEKIVASIIGNVLDFITVVLFEPRDRF